MPSNQINAIYKDSRGFMWFGTAAGLARYDGYRFKIFRSTDNGSASLPDNYIEKIVEDSEGRLWIRTGENGYNNRGNFWEMTVVTLGIVFCDTGKVSTKEERLDWPVTEEERNGEKGWGRFGKEQICRLKIRRMKEEWAKDLVVQPWCMSQVVKAHEDCAELQAVLDEYHKPVVIQDQVLGELTLDKDYDAFEGEIQWCGKDVSLSLEVNAESKPSWTRARSAAKKLLADCETRDKAMRDLAAKNLTELANNWLSQDEENPRNPETDPITEEELARRISMTSLSVTSGGSFTAWFDCDEIFTDHAVTVYGSLKKGLKTANIEG